MKLCCDKLSFHGIENNINTLGFSTAGGKSLSVNRNALKNAQLLWMPCPYL